MYNPCLLVLKLQKHNFMPICRWAWSEVDKAGDGQVLQKDLASLVLRYNDHVAITGDISALIRRCGKNHDNHLDTEEIRELLEVSQPSHRRLRM